MFKVGIGYTAKGRERWKRFATEPEARKFCNDVHAKTGFILTIIEDK